MTDKQNQDQSQDIKDEAAKLSKSDRLNACAQEISDILKKHRCRIQAYIATPELVGTDGSKVMMAAAYGLVAD